MSNVTYLDAGKTSRGNQDRLAADGRTTCVHVHEVRSGIWVVHDDLDRKGGCFRDRSSALKFVDDEFGGDAVPVIHPIFSTPAERRLLQPSVAQRAVMTQ